MAVSLPWKTRTEKSAEQQRSKRPAPPSWNFAEGTELSPGRFVLDRLGGGNRYEVHLVWDERLFALAVAKVLRPHLVADARALCELRREAALLGRLAHPTLVRAFGCVEDGPHPHLLLEHIEGPTLHRLVRKMGPLAKEQLLTLALHLASTLHYLGQERIVHLDVKPANVILAVQPRLIDLSIARSFEDATRLNRAIGTEGYMPPEQCLPSATLGPAADVWSLGATLYFAMSGEKLPRGEHAEPAIPNWVPAPLAQVTRWMLSPVPSNRPLPRQIAEALECLVRSR